MAENKISLTIETDTSKAANDVITLKGYIDELVRLTRNANVINIDVSSSLKAAKRAVKSIQDLVASSFDRTDQETIKNLKSYLKEIQKNVNSSIKAVKDAENDALKNAPKNKNNDTPKKTETTVKSLDDTVAKLSSTLESLVSTINGFSNNINRHTNIQKLNKLSYAGAVKSIQDIKASIKPSLKIDDKVIRAEVSELANKIPPVPIKLFVKNLNAVKSEIRGTLAKFNTDLQKSPIHLNIQSINKMIENKDKIDIPINLKPPANITEVIEKIKLLVNKNKEVKNIYIPIKVKYDASLVNGTIEKLKNKLAKFYNTKKYFNPTIKLDIEQFKNRLATLRQMLTSFKNGKYTTIKIKADISVFKEKINNLKKNKDFNNFLNTKPVIINADASNFNEIVDTCAAKLKELKDITIHINSNIKDIASSNKVSNKNKKDKEDIDYNQEYNKIISDSTKGHGLKNQLQKVIMLQNAINAGAWDSPDDAFTNLAQKRMVLERAQLATRKNMTVAQEYNHALDEQKNKEEEGNKRRSVINQARLIMEKNKAASDIAKQDEYRAKVSTKNTRDAYDAREKTLEQLRVLQNDYGKVIISIDKFNAKCKEEIDLINRLRKVEERLPMGARTGTIGTIWNGGSFTANNALVENNLSKAIEERDKRVAAQDAKDFKETQRFAQEKEKAQEESRKVTTAQHKSAMKEAFKEQERAEKEQEDFNKEVEKAQKNSREIATAQRRGAMAEALKEQKEAEEEQKVFDKEIEKAQESARKINTARRKSGMEEALKEQEEAKKEQEVLLAGMVKAREAHEKNEEKRQREGRKKAEELQQARTKANEENQIRTARLAAQDKIRELNEEQKAYENTRNEVERLTKAINDLHNTKRRAEGNGKLIPEGDWSVLDTKEGEAFRKMLALGANPNALGLFREFSPRKRQEHLNTIASIPIQSTDTWASRIDDKIQRDAEARKRESDKLKEDMIKRAKIAKELLGIEQKYNEEVARQNKLIEYGVILSQKQVDQARGKLNKLGSQYEHLGGDKESLQQSQMFLMGNNATQINERNRSRNAMAWKGAYFSTESERVSALTGSLERLYTELNRNPGNTGIKKYIKETEKELLAARKQAERVNNQLDKLGNPKLTRELERSMRWIGRPFGFFEPYDILARVGETIMGINEAMANLRTVMPAVQKGEGGEHPTTKEAAEKAMWEQQRQMVKIASTYGNKVEETIESARLWGRMYKDQKTVNLLTEQSAKLAVADNFSVEESTRAVEAAMFQFGMQAKSTAEALTYSNRIIDVYTKLSHNAGVTAQDLAAAVERSGSVAHQAGMDFEFLTALIAQATRSTALSGLTNTSPFMLETA